MRTVRDILFNIAEEAYDDGLNDQYEQSVDLDQAPKKLEELLLESLPENNNLGYNQALEDTRKAIKSIIGGK